MTRVSVRVRIRVRVGVWISCGLIEVRTLSSPGMRKPNTAVGHNAYHSRISVHHSRKAKQVWAADKTVETLWDRDQLG